MKKASEIIGQLKQLFNELTSVNNAEVPQPTAEAMPPMASKLQDGTEIMISEMEPGGVVTKDGQIMPPGNYTLEDGTVIVIGDNGVITEIMPPAAAPATPTAPEMPNEMIGQLSNRFQSFEAQANEKFKAYESKFAEYETRLAKATKVIEGLLNLTQTLAETPTGTPDPSIKGAQIFNAEEKIKSEAYDILFS